MYSIITPFKTGQNIAIIWSNSLWSSSDIIDNCPILEIVHLLIDEKKFFSQSSFGNNAQKIVKRMSYMFYTENLYN